MRLAKHLAQGKLVYLSKMDDAISIFENEHYRWLASGGVVQSIMNKRKPWLLTQPHQTALLLPLLFFRPTKVVELGLGGGNLVRFISKLTTEISVTSIECNPYVIDCFSQYFNPEKAPINTIESEGVKWLEKKNNNCYRWLIYDICKYTLLPFQQTIVQLERISRNMKSHTCLSLNLPDASDVQINLTLTVLQQLNPNHHLLYFPIPHYRNTVIHLYPSYWCINDVVSQYKTSYLPKRLYSRWRNFWRYGRNMGRNKLNN